MRRNVRGSYNIALEDDEDDSSGPLSFTAPTFATNNDHTPLSRNRTRPHAQNGAAAAAAAAAAVASATVTPTLVEVVTSNNDGCDNNSNDVTSTPHHAHRPRRGSLHGRRRQHHHVRNGVHAITTIHGDNNGSGYSSGNTSADSDRSNSDQDNDSNMDEDMPSVLAISRSNIPGKTPQELLAEHRKSIAEFSRRPEGAVDLHSITLSRNQIEPDVPYVQCVGSMSSTEMQHTLGNFTFGEPSSPMQAAQQDSYNDIMTHE